MPGITPDLTHGRVNCVAIFFSLLAQRPCRNLSIYIVFCHFSDESIQQHWIFALQVLWPVQLEIGAYCPVGFLLHLFGHFFVALV